MVATKILKSYRVWLENDCCRTILWTPGTWNLQVRSFYRTFFLEEPSRCTILRSTDKTNKWKPGGDSNLIALKRLRVEFDQLATTNTLNRLNKHYFTVSMKRVEIRQTFHINRLDSHLPIITTNYPTIVSRHSNDNIVKKEINARVKFKR